jgi:hypothetical protein
MMLARARRPAQHRIMKLWERRRRHAETVGMNDLIDRVLTGYGQAEDVRRYRVKTEWHRIVGERIATRTFPGLAREGVLPVRVSNSSWLHELSFMRAALVAQVNEALGDPPLIQDIRLHLGRPRQDEVLESRPTRPRRPRPRARALPAPAQGADLARIETEAGAVDDPELRALITDVRRRLDS